MSILESAVQAGIRLALGRRPDLRLWRNNRGKAWLGPVLDRTNEVVILRKPQLVDFGLADGASDLIGLRQVVVTPEMIGRTLAVFTAVEVKRPGGPGAKPHQKCFLDFVNDFGGLAGVARSPEEADAIADRLATTGGATR